jgi:hypothetical protein
MLRAGKMKHRRSLITLVVMVLVAVACGLPFGGNGAEPQAGTTPASGEQVESPTEAPTNVPTEVPSEPFLSVPGIGRVNLLTDVQGGGEKPSLAWESIPGADRYQLVVFDEAGEPYWAWEGAQTQVYMGGSESQPPADSSGPVVGVGYSWAVVAYDANGQITASSELRPVSP